VRAYMVLAALAEHGELLASVPDSDDVDGFDSHEVQAWLASKHEDDAILTDVRAVPDVAEATTAEPAIAESAAGRPVVDELIVDEPLVEGPAVPVTVADVDVDRPAAHKKAAATVRVDAERLDQLMHNMGELVVHRTLVESLAAHADVPGLSQAMQELTRSSQALQAMVMQVRMIPVDAVFMRFPRLVRDLSGKLGKDVELKLVGKDTELDRTVVELLGDPLVHLVRNSLDHGLEPPEDRAKAGKVKAGTLEISARHAGGNVVIEVRDDGRGIDPEKIGRRAVERGLISAEAAASLDGARAAELLFAPGFSTAEFTSDVSGRGVGMDAVRTTIRELGGEVTLTSELGQGTTAQIRLPLTLAIMAALLVEAGGQPFAIPLDRVERTLRLADQTVRSIAGQRMLVLRDGVLPVLDGAGALGGVEDGAAEHAVIVRGQDRRLALVVTRLVGQRELVTRPLPPDVSDRAAVSGGAVLSDGRIALIVDCDAVAPSGADRPAALVA
jgi:two-component system, chemotaxis family, sensor kinase CheA